MGTAVILNAGEGKRLRPLTELMPKCLLKLNKITVLEHQLSNLMECGIKKVVLVVGYRANQILQKLRKENYDLDLHFIYNSIYHKTNTVYSLWLAREEMRRDIVYLNGDVVFHREALARLLNSRFDACLAVAKKHVGKEEVKVQIVSNIVKAIGKNMEPSKANGEFIGIAKFSETFSQLLIDKLNEVVGENKIDDFFEVALDRTLETQKVYAVDVSDLPCIEVDTHDDFRMARKLKF